MYRELAEAGQSSKRALYTPRQATLALLGFASFAKGRATGKHPRLAHTVPAVVGIERARSAWLHGERGKLYGGNNVGKLLKSRPTLQSAPLGSSGTREHEQCETITELDSRSRPKLERQVSALKVASKFKSNWLTKDKLRNSETVVNFDRENTFPRANLHNRQDITQTVLALNRMRKSVDYWKCHMCGGERRSLLEFDDKCISEEIGKSNFYDASVAMKGLHRAKTVLDGLLYKDTSINKDRESKVFHSEEEKTSSERRQRCACSSAESDGLKKPVAAKSEPAQQHRKRQKKKAPSSSVSKSQNNVQPQTKASPVSKPVNVSRRKGVVGRPQGLFESCVNLRENDNIEREEPLTGKNGPNFRNAQMVPTESDSSKVNQSWLENQTPVQGQGLSNKIENEQSCRQKGTVDDSPRGAARKDEGNDIGENTLNESQGKLYPEVIKSSFKCGRNGQRLDSSLSSLSREEDGEPSPLSQAEDVFIDMDQGFDFIPASTKTSGNDESPFSQTKITQGQDECRSEIDKARQEERLELRDTFDTDVVGKPGARDKFDAYAVGKSRTRHLSTVKGRKFSFVSTAVSAFVKNPSSDDLRKNVRNPRLRSYSVTSQASVDSVGTSVDGGESQNGRKGSKWQLENIICASSLAKYAGRATRDENGEINYTRPWRQKKKKVNKMEVNVFYAIARFMLKKKEQLKNEREARKKLQDEISENERMSKKSMEETSLGQNIRSGDCDMSKKISTSSCADFREDTSVTIKSVNYDSSKKENVHRNSINTLSTSKAAISTVSYEEYKNKQSPQGQKLDTAQSLLTAKKANNTASFSGSSRRGSGNNTKGKTSSMTGSAATSAPDPQDIPNLASIIDPSKTPINLTNGVLDYDDDLSTINSGLVLIPGRKQVRYKGILLRNYVSPQDRYKIEPRMRNKKTTSIRWSSKEGAIVMAHGSTGSESTTKTVNVVFPKQARQRALAKMVEDNHNQPVDNSAHVANAALRTKIDQFLLSVEPFCQTRAKTNLF